MDSSTFKKGSLEYSLYWMTCADEDELRKFYTGDEKMLELVDEIARITNGFDRDAYFKVE